MLLSSNLVSCVHQDLSSDVKNFRIVTERLLLHTLCRKLVCFVKQKCFALTFKFETNPINGHDTVLEQDSQVGDSFLPHFLFNSSIGEFINDFEISKILLVLLVDSVCWIKLDCL
jgi:hypothetical protein